MATVSVCAVVLTYNREALLRRCLDALLKQSIKCDDILVVDNASTDTTPTLLRESKYAFVSACQLRHNIGFAGGFSLGMQLAYLSKADFIWVMDDDVIAEPDALERLLEGGDLLEREGIDPPFLISTAQAPCGALTNVPEVSRARNRLDYENWPLLVRHGLVPVERSTFVSILLPKKTIANYGLPLTKMKFWGVDTEYTLRISADQPGYLSAHSRVEHLRATPGRLNIMTETNETRLKWHSYLIQNDIYTKRQYSSAWHLTQYLVEKSALVMKLLARGEFKRAGIIARGIGSGLFFQPGDSSAEQQLPFENIQFLSSRFRKKLAIQKPPERQTLSPSFKIDTLQGSSPIA